MIYLIQMSKGDNIKIDEEDLTHLQDNLSAPLIRLKQGIINPSFMISITPTEEKDIVNRPKVIVEDGVAKMIGTEKVNTLVDKMQVKNETSIEVV